MTKSNFGQLDRYLAKKWFWKIIQAVNIWQEISDYLKMPHLKVVYKQKKIYIAWATAVQRQQITFNSQELITHLKELAIDVTRIIFNQ